MFDPHRLQSDFPILATTLQSGKPLVYLDNAATSQKPQAVIDAIVEYYAHDNANVHRGIHELGDRSTTSWHAARQTVAAFFGADPTQLIATRNTTEALNMVAYTWGETHIQEGDIILVTQMDHHSNLVPWQELAKRKHARVELVPLTTDGLLQLEWLEEKIQQDGARIKMLALPHVSNTLGTVNDIRRIRTICSGIPSMRIVFDAAQSAPHMKLDFAELGVDFMALSAHKMLGPMGCGALFVRHEVLDTLPPWLFGGGMIGEVSATTATFSHDLEDRFTAGTPDVAGMVGWAAACEYLEKLGMSNVEAHDRELVEYAVAQLTLIPEVTVIGPSAAQRCGSVAFLYQGVHPHDVAQILSSQGVAVRSGHHCTMPLHQAMQWSASTRMSFAVYTTTDDIDACVKALKKVKDIFGN